MKARADTDLRYEWLKPGECRDPMTKTETETHPTEWFSEIIKKKKTHFLQENNVVLWTSALSSNLTCFLTIVLCRRFTDYDSVLGAVEKVEKQKNKILFSIIVNAPNKNSRK